MPDLSQLNAKHQIRDHTIPASKLAKDFLQGRRLNLNETSTVPGTLTGIPDPVDPLDVSNRRFVEAFVANYFTLFSETSITIPSEQPRGTRDGANTHFELSQRIPHEKIDVFINALQYNYGANNDYTLADSYSAFFGRVVTKITFNSAEIAPHADDNFWVKYIIATANYQP